MSSSFAPGHDFDVRRRSSEVTAPQSAMGDRYDSSKGSEDQSSWSWRTSQAQSSSRYAATTNSLRSSTSDDRIAVLAETTRRAHEGRDDKQRHRSPQQGGWKDHRRQEYSATSRAMVRPDQPQNSLSHVDNLELSPAVPSSRQRYDAAGEHQWKESSSTFSSSPRHDGRDGGVDGSPPGTFVFVVLGSTPYLL